METAAASAPNTTSGVRGRRRPRSGLANSSGDARLRRADPTWFTSCLRLPEEPCDPGSGSGPRHRLDLSCLRSLSSGAKHAVITQFTAAAAATARLTTDQVPAEQTLPRSGSGTEPGSTYRRRAANGLTGGVCSASATSNVTGGGGEHCRAVTQPCREDINMLETVRKSIRVQLEPLPELMGQSPGLNG